MGRRSWVLLMATAMVPGCGAKTTLRAPDDAVEGAADGGPEDSGRVVRPPVYVVIFPTAAIRLGIESRRGDVIDAILVTTGRSVDDDLEIPGGWTIERAYRRPSAESSEPRRPDASEDALNVSGVIRFDADIDIGCIDRIDVTLTYPDETARIRASNLSPTSRGCG